MTEDVAKRLAGIVDRFDGLVVGVVGDMVADLYVNGTPERVSREAPVLVLRYEDEELIPGGAANTTNNLRALGADVRPVGLLGEDVPGRAVRSHFEERGVDVSGLILSRDRATTTKTRVMAGAPTRLRHQVVRVDREPVAEVTGTDRRRILDAVRSLGGQVGGWVFSDYGYGVAAPGLGAMLEGVRVADSRNLIRDYQGFTALTPNEEEAAEEVGHPCLTDGQVRKAGKTLLERTGAENVLITRGNRGMALFGAEGGELFLPVSGADEVTDVTGAGDTVVGVLTLALVAGAGAEDAARLANHAAGVVVAKAGAATLTREELKAQLGGDR